MYACMHVCVYIIYVCRSYACIMYVPACMHACMCVRVHACRYVCKYVYMHVYMTLRMPVSCMIQRVKIQTFE